MRYQIHWLASYNSWVPLDREFWFLCSAAKDAAKRCADWRSVRRFRVVRKRDGLVMLELVRPRTLKQRRFRQEWNQKERKPRTISLPGPDPRSLADLDGETA